MTVVSNLSPAYLDEDVNIAITDALYGCGAESDTENRWEGTDYRLLDGVVRVNPIDGTFAYGVEVYVFTPNMILVRDAKMAGRFALEQIAAIVVAVTQS